MMHIRTHMRTYTYTCAHTCPQPSWLSVAKPVPAVVLPNLPLRRLVGSVAKPPLRHYPMLAKSHAAIVDLAIADRRKYKETLRVTPNPRVKWESCAATDNERRSARERMRRLRAVRSSSTAKPRQRNPPKKTHSQGSANSRQRNLLSAAKPTQRNAPVASRRIPLHCCGRRKDICTCCTKARGFTIASSFKRKTFDAIPVKVRASRIQTWRDTADMQAYMRQVGWNSSMRYS